jgi:multiple sugar transport system substrate-binding protein
MFCKKKVLVCALMILLAAVGGVFARGGQDAGQGSGKTVVRFSFDQGVGAVTQQIVDQFNQSQNEVFVETVILPQDANVVHDDFVNKLASGDTSIDVMALDVVYVAEFAAAGWLEDLGTYFDKSKQSEYLAGTIEGATYQGKLVAFPWFTNASVLFYRTDVMSRLGVQIPTTYAGWMELAARAKGIEEVEYLASFQAARSEALVCNWVEYVWNNGGDILNSSGAPVINSRNNIEATTIMLNLAKNYAPAGVTTYTEPESEQVFLDGKALFIRDWSGFWSQANREGSKVAGKVAAVPLPTGPSGSGSHSCLGGLDLVINKHISAQQKAAAVKFLTYISSFDIQKQFTFISAQPPVLKAVYQDAEILRQIPFYADFYNIIATGKSRPMSPQYSRVSDAIQRHIHQALSGATSVENALNALQNEVTNF